MADVDHNSSSSPTTVAPPMRTLIGRLVDPGSHPWQKTLLAALGWLFGTITLSDVVLFCTLLLTVANLFFLIRDKWWRDRRRQKERAVRRAKRKLTGFGPLQE